MRLAIIISIILLLPITALADDLQCSIKAACGAGEANIFNFYGATAGGQHAELPGGTYQNQVCCSIGGGAIPITNDCNKPYNTTIINLAAATNSHVELPTQNNYLFRTCIGADTKNGKIACTYTGNCQADQTCLASVSSAETGSDTNLHVANCSLDPNQAYTNKICCSGLKETFVNGTVYDSKTMEGINSANVSFFYTADITNEVFSALTNMAGYYWIDASDYAIKPYLRLNAIVTHVNYLVVPKESILMMFDNTTTVDVAMGSGSSCLPDCTINTDPYHLCDPLCDGMNGCLYSVESKNICTSPKQSKGTRKIIAETDINQTAIYCCAGTPIIENKGLQNTSIDCLGQEMIKMTKIVIIDGEPVKMNVIACSNQK